MNGLRAHDPERITPYWCVAKDFIFPPLTYNGEVRILTWPQVINISKIRDIQIVGTSGLIKFWKLENILLRTVAVARAYTFLEVRSRDSTWWPDLMWPRHKNFTTDVKLINEKVCQVWLRCSFSFSSYPRKTTGGGGPKWPPPPGRRLTRALLGGGRLNAPLRFFEDSEKTAARSAAGFSPTLPPSFPQLLWKFRPKAMWGQVTRSGQVTQLQNNFPIAPRLQCFRESYKTFGIWWGHQCLQNVYLGFFISVTSGQVIFATSPL